MSLDIDFISGEKVLKFYIAIISDVNSINDDCFLARVAVFVGVE
jgi:hypothetical protein